MNHERANISEQAAASVTRRPAQEEGVKWAGVFTVECRDKHGHLKWRDTVKNVVTTVGKNKILDEALAGSAYTAAWYMGLIDDDSYTTGPAAGDTMSSHGGWAENQNYDEAARQTTAWSAASSGSKALSAALTFTMSTNSDTVKGCFLCSDSTKGGTSGVLLSAGLFTAGDKAVDDNDTLSVSYTATLT